MSTKKLLHSLDLSNGLTVNIYDHTKVYFGDYHHVRITVICTFSAAVVAGSPACSDNIDPRSILYTRTLEKMGVASGDVGKVAEALLYDFHRHALPYISSREFPDKLLKNELIANKRPTKKYLGSGV